MSIFDIIDNVDWNKNIIFLVLYITIIVLAVFIYLVPLMDNYKSVIMEYRKTNILDNQINTTLDRLKGSEINILRDNMAVFERLQHNLSTKDLQQYANAYIKGANVEDLGVAEAENGIKIHSFKITAQTRKLSNVKHLLTNISTLQNSVRIAFPITITKDERRGVLNVEISLMVYNSTRDISAIKAQLEKEANKSMETEKSRELRESIEIIESNKPAESVESNKSIESPNLTKSPKPAESNESAESSLRENS